MPYVTFRADDELAHDLRRVAQEQDRSASAVIRRALRLHLADAAAVGPDARSPAAPSGPRAAA